ELASSAGEDVVFAMNAFIKRLLAVSDPAQMKTTVSETSANQLANLMFWLMIVGYSMRNIEVRFDMERVLGAAPKIGELPPGENI
ncbi:Os02g0833400, partial [Oryza sativa Japonica Group]